MNVCVKKVSHIPAHEVILFRSIVSFLFCYAYMFRHKISIWGNERRFLLMRGAAGVASLTLFFTTLQNIPLAGAVTLQYLSPVFTALLAFMLLNERVKTLQWVAFAVSFAGVVVVKGFDERISVYYAMIGILSAFLAAVAYYSIGKAKNTEHPMVIVAYFPIIGIPVMSIACLFQWVNPHGIDWFFLFMAGVFTQIAQVNMTKGFIAEKASVAAIVKYVGLIFALLWGFVFFNEHFDIEVYAGMALIIAGVILNYRIGNKITD
jgi:drug/metabolite transporter (DMT)-like permease